MALPFIVILIVFAAFTGQAIRTPYGDGDLFWQKHLGAYVIAHHQLPNALDNVTFASPGAPWVPQEWLLGVVARVGIENGALWVLAVLAAAAVASVLAITLMRCVKFEASGTAIAIALTLLAVDLGGSYGIRAQVFAWPLFALLLLTLDTSGPAIFWALAVTAAWANVHASVMLAIPIVWLDAGVSWFGRDRSDSVRRTVLAALVPLATLATPLGVRLPFLALTLVQSPIRRWINEWQPISWTHGFFWAGAAPMVVLIAFFARKFFEERPRDVVRCAFLLILAATAARNAALFGIAAAPLASRAIDLLLGRFRWWPIDLLRDRGLRIAGFVSGLLAAVLTLFAGVRATANPIWEPPISTFQRVAELGGRRVFCDDFTVCSIALDYPSLRVFMDGRADAYPIWVWNDFNDIRMVKPDWMWLLDRFNVDTVVVKIDDGPDKALRKRRDWTALPRLDRCCRAYVRSPR